MNRCDKLIFDLNEPQIRQYLKNNNWECYHVEDKTVIGIFAYKQENKISPPTIQIFIDVKDKKLRVTKIPYIHEYDIGNMIESVLD